MNIIYLKKSGMFTTWKKEFVPIDRPFAYYLHHYPKIDKDFTIEDLMLILKQNEAEVDSLFYPYTRGFLLNPYFEEMQLPVFKEEKSKITQLVFSWSGQVDNIKEFGKPKYEISEYVHVSGRVETEKQLYSIGLTHLNEIKNATFKLEKKIQFSHTDYGEQWDENRKTITKKFFKGIKSFTLQDVIGAFLNEISFHGYPTDVDKVTDDLDKQIANKDNLKGTPIEVLFLKWAKKSFKALVKKKQTTKNILRLEKLQKEIAYYEKVLKDSE